VGAYRFTIIKSWNDKWLIFDTGLLKTTIRAFIIQDWVL
jgi:hypothetical protein